MRIRNHYKKIMLKLVSRKEGTDCMMEAHIAIPKEADNLIARSPVFYFSIPPCHSFLNAKKDLIYDKGFVHAPEDTVP